MHRTLLFCILIITGLSACATTTTTTTTTARSSKTQEKLTEANLVLDSIAMETQQYYTEAENVRHEVRALYHHPGWPEMRQIIDAMAMAASGSKEKGSMTDAQVVSATEEWNHKWNEPWQAMFSEYISLVKRCSALELQRITLQSKILEAQAKYLGAAVSEYTDGRYTQGKSMEEIVEILGRSAGELDSYTVDSMGLYP
jgi:hypothetical protein